MNIKLQPDGPGMREPSESEMDDWLANLREDDASEPADTPTATEAGKFRAGQADGPPAPEAGTGPHRALQDTGPRRAFPDSGSADAPGAYRAPETSGFAGSYGSGQSAAATGPHEIRTSGSTGPFAILPPATDQSYAPEPVGSGPLPVLGAPTAPPDQDISDAAAAPTHFGAMPAEAPEPGGDSGLHATGGTGDGAGQAEAAAGPRDDEGDAAPVTGGAPWADDYGWAPSAVAPETGVADAGSWAPETGTGTADARPWAPEAEAGTADAEAPDAWTPGPWAPGAETAHAESSEPWAAGAQADEAAPAEAYTAGFQAPEAATADAGTAGAQAPEAATAEAGVTEIGPAEIDAPEIGPAEIGAPEIDAPEIGPAEVDAAGSGPRAAAAPVTPAAPVTRAAPVTPGMPAGTGEYRVVPVGRRRMLIPGRPPQAPSETPVRALIGEQLRTPIVWCELERTCISWHADRAALGVADVRARAIAAGWRVDALGRLACPQCQQTSNAFRTTQPVVPWNRAYALTMAARQAARQGNYQYPQPAFYPR
jgi:hypothetical protein